MKIKEEFWDLIKSERKNIELRKVNKLHSIMASYIYPCFHDRKNSLEYCYNDINGRLVINLESELSENDCRCANCPKNKQLGSITINGYDVIPNYFNQLEKKCGSKNSLYQKEFLTNAFKNYDKINIGWILNNLDWLTEFFKDKEEILVLKIESWKNNYENRS